MPNQSKSLDTAELARLIALPADEFAPVFEEAGRVCRERKGDIVQIRGIIEFSNYCRRMCAYCGLNCMDTGIQRYRMEPEDIVKTAQEGWEAGYRTVVLQSGEDPWYTKEILGEIVRDIKRTTGLAVTLSCGELPTEDYAYFKDCGADRYLLKHETADPEIYAALHPDGTLAERVSCLRALKSLGYETGSGFMVGLPGQTAETFAQDIALLASIPCDMAGIGPFIPHPGTALSNQPPGEPELVRRCVALARLALPDCNLPATTALGVLSSADTGKIFSCGANVIMRKLTPADFRKLYEIYPAEFGYPEDTAAARRELEEFIRSLGKEPL